MDKICDEAYKEAVKIIKNCTHSIGIQASAKPFGEASVRVEGYSQIWSRDSMITLLGATLLNDNEIDKALKATLKILMKKQSELGAIPNRVNAKTLKPSFKACADAGLWFILGNAFFLKKNKKLLKENYEAIKKTLKWYEHQDVDQTNLITIAEASDWEDLFAVRDKGLYVNVLYYLALYEASKISKQVGDNENEAKFKKRSEEVNKQLNSYFWYKGDENVAAHIGFGCGIEPDSPEIKTSLRFKEILKKDSYYLPYLTFRDFGEWFDSFGNLLTILSGLANEEKAKKILKLIKEHKVNDPHPIKAIYPSIKEGEKDWRYYYPFGKLNLPDQYHNGGIWPFLGGFYVVALVKMKKINEAEKALESLASLNKLGKFNPWEFNEWFHAKNLKPMGMPEQAWSAGMFIYAYNAVKNKKVKFFN